MACPVDFSALLPPHWERMCEEWLQCDIPKFDVGGFVVGTKMEEALLLAKSPGVICGRPFADMVFRIVGCEVEWFREEGSVVTEEEARAKLVVARVTGPANKILTGERTALNCMARASGCVGCVHVHVCAARVRVCVCVRGSTLGWCRGRGWLGDMWMGTG
jgi:nicotinate-nucleotide pyrophosphorylase (carboxylating)